MLRHCLAPSLRDQLNALPQSLDATYERVLDEIQSTNQGRHAHRLLQCLAVAMRPLCVDELAEVLTFELDTAGGELPKYHPDWRWEDQEHAVLSACSSLITVVNSDNSRVIQFSHFSVKEYLTSERLSTASGAVSQYYIAMEPAHLILARSCLAVLLNLDTSVDGEYNESSDKSGSLDSDKGMPLLKYAAEHWTSHAQVGNVSSCLKDAMETLFNPNKPYFGAFTRIRDTLICTCNQTPLYFAALHSFYDLVEYLINRHPEQVTHHWHNDTSRSPLVAALESTKHVRIAELLVKHGAPVHVRGDPPLCHAVRFSDDSSRVNAVQLLIKGGAQVNAGDGQLMTPLHWAAYMGCTEVARILLDHGANVSLQTESGHVPLHFVSNLGDKDEGERLVLARLLLAGDCMNVNAQGLDGATPLHRASQNRRPKIVELLLAHGANAHAEDSNGRNPLHHLSPSLNWLGVDPQDVLRVTQLLLGQGVDVNVLDEKRETPLHIASSVGHLENIQVLLDHGAKADAENVDGQTPLHLVSQSHFDEENSNVTRLLLQQGMNVNTRDIKQRATPLHFASFRGHFQIAHVLLDHGADVNARNADNQTPLHRVSLSPRRMLQSGYKEANRLAQLILERGADVNVRDKEQATPLHSASFMSNLETARVLLDHGANIHAKNILGQTPLHIVSQGDYGSEPALVELLLSRGADVNARDNDHTTPFLLTSFCLKPQIAEKLLQNGADVDAVNIHGQNALHLLSQNPRHDYEKERTRLGRLFLVGGVDMNGQDNDRRTPLHLAAFYGQVDVAESLLEYAAEVNAADISGHTPLHQVTLGNHDYRRFGMDSWHLKEHPGRVIRLAERLLESGAEINAQNKDHETPLHLASRLRLHEMAQFLLKHGAKVYVMNSEGKTPLQLATGRKGKAMRRLLSEYSAKHA